MTRFLQALDRTTAAIWNPIMAPIRAARWHLYARRTQARRERVLARWREVANRDA